MYILIKYKCKSCGCDFESIDWEKPSCDGCGLASRSHGLYRTPELEASLKVQPKDEFVARFFREVVLPDIESRLINGRG